MSYTKKNQIYLRKKSLYNIQNPDVNNDYRQII